MKINSLNRAVLYKKMLATEQLTAYATICKSNQKVSKYINYIGFNDLDRFTAFNKINSVYLSRAANNDLSFISEPDFISDFNLCHEQDQEFLGDIMIKYFEASQAYFVFKKADEKFSQQCIFKDKNGKISFSKDGLNYFYSAMDKLLSKDPFYAEKDNEIMQIANSDSKVFSDFNEYISKHSPKFLGKEYYKKVKKSENLISSTKSKISPMDFGATLKKPTVKQFNKKYENLKINPLTEKGYELANECRKNPKGIIYRFSALLAAGAFAYSVAETTLIPGIIQAYEKAETSLSNPEDLEKYELSISEETLASIQQIRTQIENMKKSDQIPTSEEFFEVREQLDETYDKVVSDIFSKAIQENFPDASNISVKAGYDYRFSDDENFFTITYTDKSGVQHEHTVDCAKNIFTSITHLGVETPADILKKEKKLDNVGYPNLPGGYAVNAIPTRIALNPLEKALEYLEDIAINKGEISYTLTYSVNEFLNKDKEGPQDNIEEVVKGLYMVSPDEKTPETDKSDLTDAPDFEDR